MPGCLVLVVGPSGAGKDSVLKGAEQAFAGDERFLFPRRVVTRKAGDGSEDHVSISAENFEIAVSAGSYMLAWRAHDNGYGIPIEVSQRVMQGKVAVINVSRHVLKEAMNSFPNSIIVEITAHPDVLMQRILARGREAKDEAERRVVRVSPAIPLDAEVIKIDNNGPLEAAVTEFTRVLRGLVLAR